MRKYLIIVLTILCVTQIVSAQEHYITNLYVYDLFLMNPSAAGGDRACNKIDAYYQNQWQGMDDSPTSQLLSYQFGTRHLGSGTYVYNDANGYVSQFGVQQSISYEVTLAHSQLSDNRASLSFGLSLNANQVSIDETHATDGYTEDPAMTGAVESGWGINANTGILFKYNHYHLGIAFTNLFGQTNSLYDDESSANELPVDYHFHVGTWFRLYGRDIFFFPELMYRRNKLADSRFDANLKLKLPTYNEKIAFWGILSYRRSHDVDYGKDLSSSVTIGINYGAISCGLEYQQGIAGAQSYYGNGFLVSLGYRFGCKDPSKGSIPCSLMDVYYDGYKSKGHKSKGHKSGRIRPRH